MKTIVRHAAPPAHWYTVMVVPKPFTFGVLTHHWRLLMTLVGSVPRV